jgi:hypothetical protein
VLTAALRLHILKSLPDSWGMNKFLPSEKELVKQIIVTVVAVVASSWLLKKFPQLNGEK